MSIEEDYPGQHDEMRREKVIEQAVEAADRIILSGSNGSVEETDYLTAAVAKRFMEKVWIRIQSELLRHDLLERR